MKTCSKCKISLPLTSFYKNKATKDGFGNYCKECFRPCIKYNKDVQVLATAKWREKNKERFKELKHDYYEKNKERLLNNASLYRKTDERRLINNKLLQIKRLNGDIRLLARQYLRQLLRRKNIIKPPCQYCGGLGEHNHHYDYSKPLSVIVLCKSCHVLAHNKKIFTSHLTPIDYSYLKTK